MVSTTPNLGLNKPAVASATDENLWGAQLNTNADLLEAAVTGKQTIWIPAGSGQPATTNGCSALTQVELTAGQPELIVYDFDASTDEALLFNIAMPDRWDEGTVTYQVFWCESTGSATAAVWGLQAVALSNDDAIDTAFGTAVTITDTASGTANDLNVTSESSAITIAGTPASGDLVAFRLYRDADNGGDTLAVDARSLGVKLFWTSDAGVDA